MKMNENHTLGMEKFFLKNIELNEEVLHNNMNINKLFCELFHFFEELKRQKVAQIFNVKIFS